MRLADAWHFENLSGNGLGGASAGGDFAGLNQVSPGGRDGWPSGYTYAAINIL